MKYPELTLFDRYNEKGLQLVLLLDDTYYRFVFEDIIGFLSVDNNIKVEDGIQFPEGEYFCTTKEGDFLKSFKSEEDFCDKTLHYAFKCEKITLHIASNSHPRVERKQK